MSGAKPKILLFIDWYLPGYKAGGPIRSCANLVASLKNEFDFSVVTGNTDLGDAEPYHGVKYNQWHTAPDGTRTWYFSKDQLSFDKLKKILNAEEFDVLYINSVFSYYFSLLPLFYSHFLSKRFKTIIAPRGMLSEGALSIKSFKKKVFLFLAGITGLYKKAVWHASTGYEAEEIRKNFGKNAKIKTAINLLIQRRSIVNVKEKKPGTLKLVFLSRISLKKNLHSVLDYLRSVKSGHDSLEFDIYGAVHEPEYWKQCLHAMESLPKSIKVTYKGTIDSTYTGEVYNSYHFLILPTLNENFGHAILESLISGCPVIISDQTPWKGLEKEQAGWDIALNNEKRFVQVIEYCLQMNQEEYNLWSEHAINYAEKNYNLHDAIEQNRQMLTFAND